jgi:DnaJ-class molecular chaperone
VDYGDVDLNDLFESILGGRGGAGGGRRGRGRPQQAPGGFDPFGQHAAQATPGEDIRYPVTISFVQAIRGTSVDIALNSTDRALNETLSIKIPPGVADGKKIAARGKGNPGPTGIRGDLIIEVHVTPHDYFRREGDDILLDLPISLAEALNGATISVPTVDGPIDLRIPPGISSGKRLRIRERGAPMASGGRGDQYCRILIQIPADLTDAEKQQIAQIEKAHNFNPRNGVKW